MGDTESPCKLPGLTKESDNSIGTMTLKVKPRWRVSFCFTRQVVATSIWAFVEGSKISGDMCFFQHTLYCSHQERNEVVLIHQFFHSKLY